MRLFPALVQGEGSVEEVCRAIDYFSRMPWAELVVVGRGGGSLEDLWTFNEEAVARAIARCAVPVVSAVGHETDITIADFVADLRAPTPSAAAELIVPRRDELLGRIATCHAHATQAVRYRFAMLERRLRQQGVERALGALHRRIGRSLQRVDELEFRARDRVRGGVVTSERRRRALDSRLQRFDVRPRLAADHRRLDGARGALAQLMTVQLAGRRGRLDRVAAKLSTLSPLRILERGYAIVSNASGIMKDAQQAPQGSSIHVRLAQGELDARVS